MANIRDKACEFLADEGLKLGNPSKKAIFLFADWLANQEVRPTQRAVGLEWAVRHLKWRLRVMRDGHHRLTWGKNDCDALDCLIRADEHRDAPDFATTCRSR